jgi:hypothetical protein
MTVSITPGGGFKGVSFAASSEPTFNNLLNESSLYLPLNSTLVPARGSSTPTFTRATVAWDFDSEGKLNLNIPSGCPRFTGARLVRNKLLASEDFTSVSWSKIRTTVSSGAITLGGVTLDAVLETVDNNTHHIDQTISITPGGADTVSVYVAKLGRRYVTLDISNVSSIVVYDLDLGVVASTFGSEYASASITDVGSGVFRISMTVSETASTTGTIRLWTAFDENSKTAVGYVGDITKGFYATRVQVENVSGQADQTASEYVSVGVLSAPFHGAGVDDCKYFTTNKDGSAIPAATLKGYYAEPSRVNNCLWSRDFNNTKWAGSNTGADLVVNGTFTVDANWTKTGTATIAAGVATIPATSRVEQAITTVVGKRYSFKVNVTTASNRMVMRAGTTSGGLDLYDDSAYRTTTGNHTIYFTATTTTSFIIFLVDTGASGSAVIDDATVFETGISVASTTGLDNRTGSADRLTATANDATLLQLLTAPTGSRTTSAYIKRISGSGTVSLTRNGGTNWTDITASLVVDTWVPVEVVSDVGANPTVGLKMGTSGDVIEVDCCQDENGAWRTSPILTTTAAVTRNADVLSYTSAFDVAQGTMACSLSTASALASSDIFAVTGDSSSARLLYFLGSLAKTAARAYDGVNVASVTVSDITGDALRKRASRWGADLRLAGDGVLGASTAFDGSMGVAGTLNIGCGATGLSQLSGNIGEVHIWTSALTDAQMRQVTA